MSTSNIVAARGGGRGVVHRDAAQDAAVGVERALGELFDVHLAQALEALPPDVLDLAVALGELGGDGVALLVAEGPVDGVADLGRVQRRLRDEDPAGLEHGPHVVVDEREQQAPDVAAVDVGVAQDDDAAVAGSRRG